MISPGHLGNAVLWDLDTTHVGHPEHCPILQSALFLLVVIMARSLLGTEEESSKATVECLLPQDPPLGRLYTLAPQIPRKTHAGHTSQMSKLGPRIMKGAVQLRAITLLPWASLQLRVWSCLPWAVLQ